MNIYRTLLINACSVLLVFSASIFASNNPHAVKKHPPTNTSNTVNTTNASDSAPIDDLYELLLNYIMYISLDKEMLLHGNTTAVLSQGVWTDSDVAAYKIKYKKLPTVLPLTKYVKPENDSEQKTPTQNNNTDSGQQALHIDSPGGYVRQKTSYTDEQLASMILHEGDPNEVFYLYVNIPTSSEDKQKLIESLSSLFEEEPQSELENHHFARLPKTFQQLWKVRLGTEPPQFEGGYH